MTTKATQDDVNAEQFSQKFAIQFGNDRLEFRPATISDPVPTGRQLLDRAGARPFDEFVVLQVLPDGMLEELRPDETVDLRARGIEKFLVFKTDRTFRFELDGRVFEWGAPSILGMTLKKLAGVDPATYGVWLEVRGGEDRLIGNDQSADLAAKGIERFFTGITQTTEGLGEPVLPMKCRRYLQERGVAFEEVSDGAQRGIILRAFRLPQGKFSGADTAEILILLPAGYPDSAPDMFYAQPWLRLTTTNAYPRAADNALSFGGQNWQRWSRHNNEWRPGKDGIWTMLKRIEQAIEQAA